MSADNELVVKLTALGDDFQSGRFIRMLDMNDDLFDCYNDAEIDFIKTLGSHFTKGCYQRHSKGQAKHL